MAITEVYVDPSIAADSGTGTIGDPYGDLEYAIEQTTFDTVNGTRVNVKDSATETLAANLASAFADTVTTPAWAPTETAIAVIQGYTSVAGDGGIAVISGGDSVPVFDDAAIDYVHLIDLHIRDGQVGQPLVNLDNSCYLWNVEVGPSTGYGVLLDTNAYVGKCFFHDLATTGSSECLEVLNNSKVEFCRFSVESANGLGLYASNTGIVEFNTFHITGSAASGFNVAGLPGFVKQNSVWANGSTGHGIGIVSGSVMHTLLNNVVEGFSGAGGFGIGTVSGTPGVNTYGGNAVYDCTTAYKDAGYNWSPLNHLGDNETLLASPFVDGAGADFSPVNTGNIKEGALPQTLGP